MAGDRRTRRLTEDPSVGQRTLDSAPSNTEPALEVDASELLEAPPPQHSASLLEERQKRWLRLRERAIETSEKEAGRTAPIGDAPPSDPKG